MTTELYEDGKTPTFSCEKPRTDTLDIRLNRDLKKDTLLAIKLVYRTQEKLKELHPKAMDAVRAMGIL